MKPCFRPSDGCISLDHLRIRAANLATEEFRDLLGPIRPFYVVAADQLLNGAARNAVQIAELP